MEGNLIFELADELKALRDRKAELEAELKQINRKIYFVDADLSDLMGTTGTQNFTRDGTMFFLTHQGSCQREAWNEGSSF